jgi:tetratricopeptide (TPR) repeat protein
MFPRRNDEDEEFGASPREEGIAGEDYELEEEEEFFEDEEEEDEEEAKDADDDDDDDDRDSDETNEFIDVESVIEEGEELLDAGEFQEAVEHFEQGIEAFPEKPQIHYLHGVASLELLRELMVEEDDWTDVPELLELHEQALSAFDEALALNPDYTEALNRMGDVYDMVGSHEAAINCWEKSLELDPDQSEVVKDIRAARGKL